MTYEYFVLWQHENGSIGSGTFTSYFSAINYCQNFGVDFATIYSDMLYVEFENFGEGYSMITRLD